LAGYETFRFSWRELIHDPAGVAQTPHGLLTLTAKADAAA
jgi:hypothetical protein